MPSFYTVKVINNSTRSGTFFVFQTNFDPGMQSLAWFASFSNPGMQNVFEWSNNYSMFWANANNLSPGVVVQPAQMLPCTLTTGNQATLDKSSFGYMLDNQITSPMLGITITPSAGVQPNSVAVGIAISGSPVCAVVALPNFTTHFNPTSSCCLAFSSQPIRQGVVVDTEQPMQTQVNFPATAFNCTATFNANSTWSLAYS